MLGGKRRQRQSDDDPDALAPTGGRDCERARAHAWDRPVAERPLNRLQGGCGGGSQGERRQHGDEHGRAAQRS
jgi:hypothetical protein